MINKYSSKKILGINIAKLINYNNLILRHATPKKILNAVKAIYESKTRPSYSKAFPFYAQIETHNTCSLKCHTCPTGAGLNPDKTNYMSFETYKEVFDQLKDYLFYINLFGFGEPFLHKSIFDMISYTTSNNVGVVISTNLNNIKPEDAERLINTNVDSIILSLDGITQDVYSKYRTNGDVNKVIENIRAITKKKKELGRSRPFLRIQFIMMEHNIHQIHEMYKLASELEVDNLYFEDFGPDYKVKITGDKSGDEAAKIRQRLMFCKRLWTSTYINNAGKVRPCCLTFDGDYGNITEKPFEEIWNSESYMQSRKFLSENKEILSTPFHTPCFGCQLLEEHTKIIKNFDKFVEDKIDK